MLTFLWVHMDEPITTFLMHRGIILGYGQMKVTNWYDVKGPSCYTHSNS